MFSSGERGRSVFNTYPIAQELQGAGGGSCKVLEQVRRVRRGLSASDTYALERSKYHAEKLTGF